MRLSPLKRRWTTFHNRTVVLLGLLLLVLSGCSYDFDNSDTSQIPGPNPNRPLPADSLDPFGPVAREQNAVLYWVVPISIFITLLVFGGLAYIVVRYRDRGQEELPGQNHGNNLLEMAWTITPAVILALIAVPTVQSVWKLAEPPAEDAIEVSVVGKQYWWQFEYPEEGVLTANELHVPVGREIYIALDGSNPGDANVYGTPPVIHSFWVPSLSGKRDFVPGAIRYMRIQADEVGVYPGNCAEYCGLSHANMRFTVIAHEQDEYDAWIAEQQGVAVSPTDPLAAEGEQLFADLTCIACHTIDGHPENADSLVGPSLTHFASREAFAGYIYDSPFGDDVDDPEQAMADLREWLRNPLDAKPGSQMPDLNLSEDQIDALVAYLGTLE